MFRCCFDHNYIFSIVSKQHPNILNFAGSVSSESLSADYFFLNKNPVFIPLYEDATPDNADMVVFDDAAPSV